MLCGRSSKTTLVPSAGWSVVGGLWSDVRRCLDAQHCRFEPCQGHAGRGPGAAMHAMATVSPCVQGTMILRTLGCGTYGRVVLARDGPECSVDLAMKFARGTTRKNVLWEAAILREVAHAHVIRLFDVRASTPGGEEHPSDLPTLVFLGGLGGRERHHGASVPCFRHPVGGPLLERGRAGARRAGASGEAPSYMLVPRRPAHAWHAGFSTSYSATS